METLAQAAAKVASLHGGTMMRVMIVAAAGLLAACAQTPASGPGPSSGGGALAPPAASQSPVEALFVCDNGVRLAVTFTDAQAIVRMEDGTSFTLAAEPAASGYSYGNGGRQQLRGKGTEATFTIGRAATMTCADVTQAK